MADDAPHHLFQFQQTPSQITPHGHRRRRHHCFPIGSVVEVKTDEEDFRGVYFSATVLSPPNSPNKKKSRKLYVVSRPAGARGRLGSAEGVRRRLLSKARPAAPTIPLNVEVSFAREELQDVWCPAKILEDLGNLTFLV